VKTPTVRPAGITKKYVERMKEKAFEKAAFAVEEGKAQELISARRQRLFKEAAEGTTPPEPERFRG
jgi:hypothetical protein